MPTAIIESISGRLNDRQHAIGSFVRSLVAARVANSSLHDSIPPHGRVNQCQFYFLNAAQDVSTFSIVVCDLSVNCAISKSSFQKNLMKWISVSVRALTLRYNIFFFFETSMSVRTKSAETFGSFLSQIWVFL